MIDRGHSLSNRCKAPGHLLKPGKWRCFFLKSISTLIPILLFLPRLSFRRQIIRKEVICKMDPVLDILTGEPSQIGNTLAGEPLSVSPCGSSYSVWIR